jgi:hypothetical protein
MTRTNASIAARRSMSMPPRNGRYHAGEVTAGLMDKPFEGHGMPSKRYRD